MSRINFTASYSGRVLWSGEAATQRDALEIAAKSGAYLRGANLEGADLRGADLRGAHLRGADMGGAYLRGANLEGADLRGAHLRGADMGSAYLRGANLEGADLRGAHLRGADMGSAYLRGANLREADLGSADLSGADLRGAHLGEADLGSADLSGADLRGAHLGEADIPVVPHLDHQLLAVLDAGGTIAMDAWHTCATTHCRAGWAITLAGQPGAALEDRLGSSVAGALIYHASAGYVPDFYTSAEEAYADIRAHADADPVPQG